MRKRKDRDKDASDIQMSGGVEAHLAALEGRDKVIEALTGERDALAAELAERSRQCDEYRSRLFTDGDTGDGEVKDNLAEAEATVKRLNQAIRSQGYLINAFREQISMFVIDIANLKAEMAMLKDSSAGS